MASEPAAGANDWMTCRTFAAMRKEILLVAKAMRKSPAGLLSLSGLEARLYQMSDFASWHPEQLFFLADFNSLRAELQQLTPANDELLRFAERHPPDMSWWTDTTNPFEVEQDAEA